ncbi:MAG TPA: GAF domain-containing protein [Thermoleophilaceae bacterium]|nr:GAF domain-containing protein [Thermoleophilaceae bacterium]
MRQAWEDFVGQGHASAVRIPILRSWERSHAAGVDPFRERVAPTVGDADEISSRWAVHPLAAAEPLILELLGEVAYQTERIVAVTDASGVLLWVTGDPRAQLDAAGEINLAPGAQWSENSAGTNAIGTALAGAHPLQVFAAEHFNEGVQAWVCAAAPIHDPDSGELLGVVDLTARAATATPHAYTAVVATARAVEVHLRSELLARDFRLLSRYGELVDDSGKRILATPTGRVVAGQSEEWPGAGRLALPPGGGELILPSGELAFAEPVGHGEAYVVQSVERAHAGTQRARIKLRLLGHDRAVIEQDGRTLVLSRRLSEVLALLAFRPAGMSGEELAADLYGDAGQPGAARVEVYRLRQALPGAVETDPYRLVIGVESDVARIRGLLDRGDVREAAARYDGPLLPHSDAPGVIRDRDALDAWLRNAVMTADDAEALWAWVQGPSGRDDLPAWKRLLAQLEFRDPRRSLAASQVALLRARYAVPPKS